MINLEKKVINKFSKFILKFEDDNAFTEFIKDRDFKINEGNICYFISRDNHFNLLNYHNEVINKRGLKLRKFKDLSKLYFSVLVLEKNNEKIGLIPLNTFINGVKYKKLNLEKLFEEMEESKHFFLCWNKDTMLCRKKEIVRSKVFEKKFPKANLTKERKEKFKKLLSKAMTIYNRTLWIKPNKKVLLVCSKVTDEGLSLALKGKKNTIAVKINGLGQITDYGIIKNLYDGKPIPDKTIKRLNEAIRFFKEAIKIYPRNFVPYYYLARTYQFLSLFDESIKYFKLAQELRPNDNGIGERIKECKSSKERTSYFIVKKNI